MQEIKSGEVLAGKFRIERVLGRGGMGVVVEARHLQLDERVAIKFLLDGALANAETAARFAREARVVVKIKSEHVARVSDVGVLDNGSPYMVMEFLEGRDLSQLLRERAQLAVEECCDYVLQACEALAEAHALGVVHRDLKPANLFLTHRADGSACIKVLDFGISKLLKPTSGQDAGMTSTQAVMGSPLYMSPEQMESTRDVDARTDIWSLGVILYELVTGKVPFDAPTLPQLCTMVLQQMPALPRSLRPDIPEALEQAIFRCLAKDRAARFQNVAELAHAIAAQASPSSRRSAERISKVLSAAGVANLSPTGVAASAEGAADSTHSAWGQTASRKSARGRWLLAIPAVLLALGAAAFFALTGSGSNASVGADLATASALPAIALAPSAPPVIASAELPVAVAAAPAPQPSSTAGARPVRATAVKPAAKPPSKRTIDPLDSRR